MTRIIAGAARGRRLTVPPGNLRPTTDRVRESLFASLDHELGGFAGIAVLDLYAGSGALGLEALSRGASRAALVERDVACARVARANAESLHLRGASVVTTPVLTHLGGAAEPVDLVLADPPYDLAAAEVEKVLAALVAGWLRPEAVVVVERATRGGDFRWPTRIRQLRTRAYGGTTLWYGRAASEGRDT